MFMIKKLVVVILIVSLLLTLTISALGAMSLSNFDRIREYQGNFADVPPSAWFYPGVRNVYERGIMDGRNDGSFDPQGAITIAETVKIASTLHRIFHTGFGDFTSGSPWYMPYLEYAHRNGLRVGAFRNFNMPITRADFAVIMESSLPNEVLTPISRIPDGAIPDVYEHFSYGRAVYTLYRAGVLTGFDAAGTFFPGRTLTRAEAATIVSRMIDADSRVLMTRDIPLTAEQVYELASPAVFTIHVFNSEDESFKYGSGFFISESGLALTNYHVIVGAHSASITTFDGEVFWISGMYDFDRAADIALIQVYGDGFSYLEVSDATVRTGATVYALGSPLGLQSSFSRGIVSQAAREIDGFPFIQLDAAIAAGSSGGALLDTYGRVIGVTTAALTDAQNINLALPIALFMELDTYSYAPLNEFLISTVSFPGFAPAPDFGAHFGVRSWYTRPGLGGTSFSYRIIDLPGHVELLLDEYMHLLAQNAFEHMGYITVSDTTFRRYYNAQEDIIISIAFETIRTVDVITVNVA